MLHLNIRLPELEKVRTKVSSRPSRNFSPTRKTTNTRSLQTEDRLLVNYIRHVTLQYDTLMDLATTQESKVAVVRYVYSCIGKNYPELAWEASRQLEERTKILIGELND